jgi:hypothetical protein
MHNVRLRRAMTQVKLLPSCMGAAYTYNLRGQRQTKATADPSASRQDDSRKVKHFRVSLPTRELLVDSQSP